MTNPLLVKIKESVITGDWQGICNIYNKMTGENISPPVVEPEPFDYKKAKKSELIKEITDLGGDENVAKKMKVKDLRDFYELLVQSNDFEKWNETEKVNQELQEVAEEIMQEVAEEVSQSIADGYFVDTSKDVLQADLRRAQAKLAISENDLGSFGSEGTTRTPHRQPAIKAMIMGHCPACNTRKEIPQERIFSAEGSEPSGTCEDCLYNKR